MTFDKSLWKVSHIEHNAFVPKLLPIPTSQPKSCSGSRSEVVAENLVLTARRTENPVATLDVQGCVGLGGLVAAGYAIGPDATELIEVIESAAATKIKFSTGVSVACKERRDLLRVIADKVGCGPTSCEMNGRSCPALTTTVKEIAE